MTLVSSRVTLGLFVLLVFAWAGTALANHSWGKYHWDLSTAQTEVNPLRLGDNLTSAAWRAALATSSQAWNFSVLKNRIVPGTSDVNCNPTPGQVEVCNGSYGDTGWLGIAQVWAYRGKDAHIAQATTLLNDTYFNTPQYNTAAWRNFVMCQEVGHTFGLDHQDENFGNANLGTCMDYTSDPDGTIFGQIGNESPNAHDYEQLAAIYAHVNQTGSGGGGNGPGRGGGKKNSQPSGTTVDQADWGQAVAQDAQGKNSLYVRNLDNGMVLITHVLWKP